MSVRILIADDHPLARGALKLLLASEPVEICGEAENGVQAVEKARELKPDIVILDLLMPEMNGVEAADKIRQIAPTTKMIFMSLYDTETTKNAHLIGPFVAKTTLVSDLVPALRNLISGQQGPAPSASSPQVAP
jgi:DNA-binding NarL/FixJ family response regulator